MLTIGLTGSIGMGKSTVASQFKNLGAKICSADAIVHGLLANDKEVYALIKKEFPTAIVDKKIDRRKLGQAVFGDETKKKKLEAILHPLVVQAENDFIRRMQRLGARLVVVDIPLLFETQGQDRFDMVVVASAPYFLQQQRVMKRMHMTEEKFAAIVASQTPDAVKRLYADAVIRTGLGKAYSFRMVKQITRAAYAA